METPKQAPPPHADAPPSREGDDDSASLVIHCRRLNDPSGECVYCDKAAEYKIANGADPEFEKVCSLHAGQFVTSAGMVLSSFGASD